MESSRLTKYQVQYLKSFQTRNQHLNIPLEKLYNTVKNTFQNLKEPISFDEVIAFSRGTYITIESVESDYEELIKYEYEENKHKSIKLKYKDRDIKFDNYGSLKVIYINDEKLLSCSISKSKKQIRCEFKERFITLTKEKSIWFYETFISPLKSKLQAEKPFIINKSTWDFLPSEGNPIYFFSDLNFDLYEHYFNHYNYLNEEHLESNSYKFSLSYIDNKSPIINQLYSESKYFLNTINEIFVDLVSIRSEEIVSELGYSIDKTQNKFIRLHKVDENLLILYVSEAYERKFKYQLNEYATGIGNENHIIQTTHKYFLEDKSNLNSEDIFTHPHYGDNTIMFSQTPSQADQQNEMATTTLLQAITEDAENDIEDQTKDKLIELILNSTSHDILKIATFFSGLINNKKYDISILKENSLIENLSPIFITNNLDISLLDYQIKLNFNPRQKVLYLLYLENPKGIHLNNLIDHRKRLQELYNLCRPSASEEMTRSVINKMTDNFNYQEKNKIISRIKTEVKTAFLRINPKLAELYYINGARGEEKNIEIVSYGEDYIGYYFEF